MYKINIYIYRTHYDLYILNNFSYKLELLLILIIYIISELLNY